MANIIRARSWGQVTPPLGVKFDAGHPLAQNLAGAWIGQPGSPAQIDDLLGLHTVRIADTTSVGRPLGPYTPTGGRGYEIQSVGSSLRPVSSVSLMWRGVMVGTSDATTEMFGIGYNSTTTSPFASYELARNGTDLQWYMSAGGGFTNLTLDAAPPVGIPVTYVVTWPFGSNVVCYRNGVQIYKSPSTYAAPIYSTTSTMHINGGGSAIARSANCITQAGYIWKERVLSPQDAIALATEPYAFVAPPGPKVLYFALGKVAATFSAGGAISGTGVLSGSGAVTSATTPVTPQTSVPGGGRRGPYQPLPEPLTVRDILLREDEELMAVL